LFPPFPALGEDGLQVAFKEGASVLEVLLGVGFDGGDSLKRFVEDADDPLLFGEWRDWNVTLPNQRKVIRISFALDRKVSKEVKEKFAVD
jgi:hypothetical protein